MKPRDDVPRREPDRRRSVREIRELLELCDKVAKADDALPSTQASMEGICYALRWCLGEDVSPL